MTKLFSTTTRTSVLATASTNVNANAVAPASDAARSRRQFVRQLAGKRAVVMGNGADKQ